MPFGTLPRAYLNCKICGDGIVGRVYKVRVATNDGLLVDAGCLMSIMKKGLLNQRSMQILIKETPMLIYNEEETVEETPEAPEVAEGGEEGTGEEGTVA